MFNSCLQARVGRATSLIICEALGFSRAAVALATKVADANDEERDHEKDRDDNNDVHPRRRNAISVFIGGEKSATHYRVR